jgi:hypothetical protein
MRAVESVSTVSPVGREKGLSMSNRDSDVRRESGISRRELLKRGAVVGGTMVWAVPVLQSLTPPAFAQATPRPCGCCYCWNGDKENPTPQPGAPNGDFVADDGCQGFLSTPGACAQFCRDSAPGGPFFQSEQCCGTSSCRGHTDNDTAEPNGCFCS